MKIKKMLTAIFIVSIMITVMTPLFANTVLAAIEPAPFSLEIPKAVTAPVIDGKVDVNGEWKDAWHGVLDSDNPGGVRLDTLEPTYHTIYDYYMMWDETNLYVACVCTGDKTGTPVMNTGLDTRDNDIRGDGFQLFINPGVERGKDDIQYFWSDFYCEYAPGVTPFWWEYTVYDGDNNDEMANELNITIAAERNGENWAIEVCIPWEDLLYTIDGTKDQFDFEVPMTAGKDIKIEFASMDFTGDGDNCRRLELSSYDDGEDMFTVENFHTFKTTANPAGLAPVSEEPEVEENADAGEPAPAPSDNASTSPKTSDPTIFFIMIISTIISGGVIIYKSFGKKILR